MKIDDLTVDDINGILSHWLMLKVLHVPSEMAMAQIGINLNAHTLLRKIIVPKRLPVPMKELEDWLPEGRKRMDDLLSPDNPIKAEDRVVATMELQVSF